MRDLVAVLADERALGGHAHGLGQLGVVHEVAVLAVHRHEPLRLDDRQEGLELLLLGVAGGVHVLEAGVDDLGAEAHEPVDHLGDAHLVARDRVRAEDHGVAVADLEPAVLAGWPCG